MISLSGLDVRADGVLTVHGVPLEARNTMWNNQPVSCVAACLDPKLGLVWRVDHAHGTLADQIVALGAIDQMLEAMWSLPPRLNDEDADPARPDQ